VRFYNTNLIHSQVLGALREKLLGTNLQTQAKLPVIIPHQNSTSARSVLVRDQKIADAMAEFFKKHRPVQTQQQFGPAQKKRFVPLHPSDWQTTKSQTVPSQHIGTKGFLQIHDSFIVAEADDGFIIIDQHALHERIIYEDLCRRIQKSSLESQKLLIPESFQLTDTQADVLKANAKLLEKLGIELAPFGPKTYAIQAFPALLAKAAPLDFVQDLIDLLTDKGLGLDAEELLDEVLNMAACKAAIKAGQKLTDNEIEQMLADRERTERASRCPHGRPAVIKFTSAELERQFGRK
jgi:DNA mismatch repair protein MutL